MLKEVVELPGCLRPLGAEGRLSPLIERAAPPKRHTLGKCNRPPLQLSNYSASREDIGVPGYAAKHLQRGA